MFEDDEDDDDFAAADAALEAMRSVLASGREAISSANSPQPAVASSRIVRGDMSGGKRSGAVVVLRDVTVTLAGGGGSGGGGGGDAWVGGGVVGSEVDTFETG
jgi:hypothetical protein